MERVILHADMNAFYASVETLSHPEARGCPMAVCGDVESRRGIVLAKNELAKACGVKTAEPVWQAKKKCPNLLLLPPHHALYSLYSKKANEIYLRFTDLVEPVSIDESYLDVTASKRLFGGGEEIAGLIHQAVKQELGLTVSIGVSFCKIFAKMGSDYKKPDATTVISRENFKALLYPLPIGELMGVGASTAKQLAGFGVKTIGDLAQIDEAFLTAKLGKHGKTLYRYVNGLDSEPVVNGQGPPKSIGNSTTFPHDLRRREEIRTGLAALCESVASRLRKQHLRCGGVQVAVKTPDFHKTERQAQMPYPSHLAKELFDASMELVDKVWKEGEAVRLLSVTAIELIADEEAQVSIFEDVKREALETSLDKIREKYGFSAISPASRLKKTEVHKGK